MLAAVVLAGLVLVAGLSARSGVPGAALLAAVSVLWLVVNGPVEGVLILRVTADHGVTGADLAGFAGLTLAGFRAYRGVQSRPPEPGRR